MMYFIPWVIFLVIVILSVPIASWMEKRKQRAAYGDQMMDEEYDEFDEEEAGESDDQQVMEGEPEEAVFEEAEAGDDDAFAAFE